MVIHAKTFSASMNAKTLGSGDETLVLAHGFGGDQSMWDKVVPQLSTKYNVLVFDWIFSGAIDDQSLFDPEKYTSFEAFADDLISLLEEMKLNSIVFVAHSMSGMIGCIASIKRPDLFKRLILVGASPRYINMEDYEGGFSSSDIDQLLSSIKSNFNQWASNMAPVLVDEKDNKSVEKFQKSMESMRPEVALVVAKLIFLGDYRVILEKVTIPCTIVQTSNDGAVPMSVATYMQKNIKGESTVEIVSGDGHCPHLTAHVQFLEILSRVLGCEF